MLCALALTVGFSINYQLVMDAFSGKTVATPVGKTVPPATGTTSSVVTDAYPDLVELEELDELLVEGALLVDARNLAAYRISHPLGAVPMPLEELTTRLPRFLQQVPRDRVLIVYCTGFGCPDSFDLGARLLREGYRQVRVFEGGFPLWRDEGRPLAEGLE